MSIFHRVVCSLLSLSLAISAGPMAYAAQKSKAPATKSATKAPATKSASQSAKARAPTKAAATAPVKGAASAAALSKSIDLRHVQPGAFAVAVLHPRALFTAPGMELFPQEVITATAMKEFGIDPAKIDRVIISIANFDPPNEPLVAAVAFFSEPLDPQRALASLKQRSQESTIDGKNVWIDARAKMTIHQPNDRTVVVGSEPALRSLLAGGADAGSPIVARLKQTDFGAHVIVIVSIDAVRQQFEAMVAQAPPLPPPFQDFITIPQLTSAVEMRALIGGSPDFEYIFHARDEQAAVQLERLVNQGLAMAKEFILAQTTQQFTRDDPIEQATAQYMRRILEHIATLIKPTRNGTRVAISIDTQGGPAMAGVLLALLLPATQAAREAARRNASINNMRQISLAMLNYHDVHKTFPPRAKSDDQGKPLLSWRVLVLPYLEEAELYKQFHLDEPWDSDHNKKLLDKMPAVYQNPNLPPSNKTNYLVPVGEDTIFGSDTGTRLRDIKDGTSKTILFVEVDPDRAVPWTKPDDYEVDEKQPFAGLGKLRAGDVFGAAFADGSVRMIVNDLDPAVFLLLLKKSDGQPVPIPD